ncbi:probable LRR receptor-like serine/threonine-protein kinase At3g47570 [Actinidia eriantha]|uniref:probable LRR receptor-like serine/threonine-protein kinase At3g47570 n=1 Tax=Actinidia eriantha TaxID=165200 RepID=UPI00258BDB71|nr:probable LRR receptor-like serine/threonine-protein kinase At3g47570 [Actinidia eriantha]
MNLLNGYIPLEVGNLKAVYIMDLSSNSIAGDIPTSLGYLQSLDSLYMSNNSFTGLIPETFSKMIVLQYLDLSSNSLSGTIPKSLQLLRDLKYLNLSFNRLEGEIPHEGVFAYLTYQSIMGNPRLCGNPELHVPSCPAPTKPRRRTTHVLQITIPIASAVVLLIICFSIFITLCRKKDVKGPSIGGDSSPRIGHQIITYQELLQATEHFSESNLVGNGSSSFVYKGILSDGSLVAIKVFNMQSEGVLKFFDAECEVMCNARHRNLVKIISTCSNVDFSAMVLEYMTNGSLDKWLYSHNNFLSLAQRLDIMTDVALALEYLHHECTMPIVHCDLKPSNVLLDEDMTARVADFGIVKLLAQDQAMAQTKTLGTIGYIAPEYGLDGHVSPSGDVYSFGILMLETFTRRRPTEDMFRGDLSLNQWVTNSFPQELTKVLDSNLLRDIGIIGEDSSSEIDENSSDIEKLLVSIFHVALQCLKESPEERINTRDVVVQLKKIKKRLETVFQNK